MKQDLVRMEDVCVSYKGKNRTKKEVLKGISLSVHEGEILGLAGESGSGKTTIARAILGIVKAESGVLEVSAKSPQMVFQDPYSSLNPAMTVGWIMQEPLRLKTKLSKVERKERVLRMLQEVGLDESCYERKPSELSGGQRQRVGIGTALMTDPSLLIADEPVSALDVTVQAQVLALMKELHEKKKLTILFISHDLRTMYHFCDRILILKDGKIIEEGCPAEMYRAPREEYTRILLESAGIFHE